MSTRYRCSKCGRLLRTAQGASDHIRMKHAGDATAINDTQRRRREEDDEPSLAEIAVEASIKRASGIPLDPLEESLLQ